MSNMGKELDMDQDQAGTAGVAFVSVEAEVFRL